MVARHTFACPVNWALSSDSGNAVRTGTRVCCTDFVVTAALPALGAQASVQVESIEAHRLAATLHAHTLVHVLAHGVEPTTNPSCSAVAAEACRTINAMTFATTHNVFATAQWPVSAQSLGDPWGRGGDNGGDARNRDARNRCCDPFK